MVTVKVFIEGGCCTDVQVEGVPAGAWHLEIIDYDRLDAKEEEREKHDDRMQDR